jgi:hypothetical protein
MSLPAATSEGELATFAPCAEHQMTVTGGTHA